MDKDFVDFRLHKNERTTYFLWTWLLVPLCSVFKIPTLWNPKPSFGNLKQCEMVNYVFGQRPSTQSDIAMLIGKLMDSMEANNSNSRIQLSSKSYSNITLVHFRTNSELNHPAFIKSLASLQPLANQLGATVELTSYRNNISPVALSFISEGCLN